MGDPCDGVGLTASRRMLNEIVVSSSFLRRGIDYLANMKRLKKLSLGGPRIDNDAVGVLCRLDLPVLGALDLRGGVFSDECVEHLANMKSLTEIDLRGTGVTKNGIDKLQSALPDARIIHSLG